MEVIITKSKRKFGWEIIDRGYCSYGHSHELPILELRSFFNSEATARSDALRMLELVTAGKI